ncbi:MAG: hypothetical protein WCP45_15165 [Verrucomicrobiota bacterium]
MTRDDEPAIEVEVLAIDGAAPPPPGNANGTPDALYQDESDAAASHTRAHWQSWPGQVRTLHPLWWPVLMVGGCILLALFLTLGLCVAILFTVYRIVRGFLRALFG